jgi:hypothetical protein
MSDNISNQGNKNEEIDLLDLFKRIGSSFSKMISSLGRGILISILFLVRRWLPVSLSIVVGTGLSFLISKSTDPVYSSDMVLRTNASSAEEMISYINRLYFYCRERDTAALSSSLSINAGLARKISEIRAFWIIDLNYDNTPDYVDYKNSHNVYDTTNVRMTDRFDIRLRIKSIRDLLIVKEGIMSYIKKDSLFQQRNRVRLAQNQELVTRMIYDIKQLDSLQKVKYFEETRNRMPKTGGQIVFLQQQETQLIIKDIYDLYDKKLAIESNQKLYTDLVTVISDFYVPVRQMNNTIYYGKVIVPVFFGLTLIILIFITNRKKLNKFVSNS